MKYLACFSLLCSSMASAIERPNIIYIFTDQQTASAMSCAGNPDLHTPNLDRLAAAGILFNNAYCTAPLSGPSRGAMFTGYYPDAVGLSVNGSPMPDSLKAQTLGTLIKNAGYDCAYGGKWHLPLLEVPDKEYGVRTSLMEILIYLIYGIVRDCLPILPKTRMMLTSLKVKESITTMYIQPLVLPPKTGVCTDILIIAW